MARAAGRGLPARAGDGRASRSASGSSLALAAGRHRLGWWVAALLGGPGAAGGRRWSPPPSPTAAKWLLVGRHPRGRAPAVELVRLAQRAGRHLRRGGRRAVVRPRRRPAPSVLNVWLRSLGARIGRGVWCETYWLPEPDLVELRRRGHRQPGLRGADPPVPRPGAEHGPGRAAGGRDPRPEQRDPARRDDRPARYGRPGVAGDERRVGARQDPLDRQPDRPVGRATDVRTSRVAARPTARTTTCPATATPPTTSTTTTSTWTTRSSATALAGDAPPRRCVALEDLDATAPRPARAARSPRSPSTAAPAQVRAPRGASCASGCRAPIAAGRRPSAWPCSYAGHPRPLPARHLGDVGWEELTDGVIVAGQPHGAPSWFPCNDRPDDKATLPHHGHAPTGLPRRRQRRARSTRGARASATTWVYEQPEPMATYLATVQIGRYERARRRRRRCPSTPSLPARLLGDGFDAAFGRQPRDDASCFVRAVRRPTRSRAYTVVVTDDDLEIPLESQGLSTFGAQLPDRATGTRCGWSPTSWRTSGSATA